jgi:hypothetical protein
MHTVALNELKAVQKVSAQEGQRGAVNKTSLASKVQNDDFQEVMRHDRYISNNTSQTAKKPTPNIRSCQAAFKNSINS